MDLPIDIRILVYVLVVAVVVLVIYFIVFLKKITIMLDNTAKSIDDLSENVSATLQSIDTDVSQLKTKLVRSLDDVDELTVNLIDTTKELRTGLNRAFDVIAPVEKMVDNVVGKVEPPLNQLATFVAASSKAVNTFLYVSGLKKKS